MICGGRPSAAAAPSANGQPGVSWPRRTWGFQQKHRADELAAQTQRQDQELTRLAALHASEVAKERQAKEQVQQELQLASRKGGRKSEPYLVIPVEKPLKVAGDDYQRVKQKP